MSRIAILGGYGAFGARVAERLARAPDCDLVIAGRSSDKAAAHAARLATDSAKKIVPARLDATTATPSDIRALGARVLINASGPFQTQDYTLARACIAAVCHYIDLADARAFVCGIDQLDAEARAAGVSVISGASSVPGLSSAVVRHFVGDFQELTEIEIGISPGNSFDPGIATTASILSQAGKPHTVRDDGRERIVYGWQGLQRHSFPEFGSRLMSNVNVPDLELLPARYPSLQTVRFSAGLEVTAFHLGLWGMSWAVRAGVLNDAARLAGPLLRAKRALRFLGSDEGGMYVTLRGRDAAGEHQELQWTLIARSGHGPFVPAISAVILARRLAAGHGVVPGAGPCMDLFELADFAAETTDLDIACDSAWRPVRP